MSTSLGLRRVYAFFRGGVNPDSHGQWAQIDLFDDLIVGIGQGGEDYSMRLQTISIVQSH